MAADLNKQNLNNTFRLQRASTDTSVGDGHDLSSWRESLELEIGQIFAIAQKTTSSHRKNIIHLRNILESCRGADHSSGRFEGIRQSEKLFCMTFMKLLSRVLVINKREVVGDRVLRFVAAFLGLLVESEPRLKANTSEVCRQQSLKRVTAFRLITYIFKCLLPLLVSKDKTVRYRTTQLIGMLLNDVIPNFPFEFEAELFGKLKAELLNRVTDREASVRIQSTIALIRLYDLGVDVPSTEENSPPTTELVGVLIDALQNDPYAEARRAILINMPVSEFVLPYLLERARDLDETTRKIVFTRILPTLGDFRQLSNSMRMKMLTWGLNDRDASVRNASSFMFNYKWMEDAEGDILEVLERMHLVGPDGACSDTATLELAMRGFWEARQDIIELVQFDGDFWDILTPESAFLARTFKDHCHRFDLTDTATEDKMPEVTKLAYYLQVNLEKLFVAVTSEIPFAVEASETFNRMCNSAAEQEFVVKQLLLISKLMDYSDEIGRRKMFALMRDSLAITEYPDQITKLIGEVLAKISLDEKDFCMVALEVIAEIQDKLGEADNNSQDDMLPLVEEEDSFHSALSDVDNIREQVEGGMGHGSKLQEKVEELTLLEINVNLKSLLIAQCMLENVHGELMQNSYLVTMLNGLVVPAVRSHEASIRELGLRCLGLSCLLDQSLAEDNLTLFAHCFNKGHASLQIEALHIISDILMAHGSDIFLGSGCILEQRTLYRMMAKAIRMPDAEEVQACAVEVACKLLLAQVVKDDDLIRNLVLVYFDPDTADNATLRQTLNYFLPVYFYSNPVNQARMQTEFVTTLQQLVLLYDSVEQPTSMVPPAIFTSHLLEWTDPRKVFTSPNGVNEAATASDGHVNVAIDAMSKCLEKSCTRDFRKILLSLVPRFYIPKRASKELLEKLRELFSKMIQARFPIDNVSAAILTKAEASLNKLLNDSN